MERKNILNIIKDDFQKAKSSKPLKIVFFVLLAFSFIAAITSLLELSYQKSMPFIERMRFTDVNVTEMCVCLFIPFFIFATSKESIAEKPIGYIFSKLLFAVAYVIVMYLFYIVANLVLHLIFVNTVIGNGSALNSNEITIQKSIGYACSNCLILCMLSIVVASVSIMLRNLVLSLVVIVPYRTFVATYLYERIFTSSSGIIYKITLLGNVYNMRNYYGDTAQILTAIGVCAVYVALSMVLCILVNKGRAKKISIES